MPTLWETAKAKLTEEIKAGNIKDECKASYIHKLDPVYQAVKIDNFVSNVRALRKRLKRFQHYAEFDDEALRNDRELHPIEYEGRWGGSEAERLLNEDVKSKKHKPVVSSRKTARMLMQRQC